MGQRGRTRSDESTGDSERASDESDQTATPTVSVRNLVKEYGNGDEAVRAVDGVSFDIEPGTAVGILGPNGAGKTTLIKCVLSLIVPTDGAVSVAGKNTFKNPKYTFERTGAVFEGARNVYWRLTVRENLEIFSVIGGNDYRNRTDRIDELLEKFGLADKEDTVVRELSRGQKQKVTLSCTMARGTDVVFLDEPTLGLDVESSLNLQQELRTLVEDEATTVVLLSHNMDVVQNVCDRVIILNDGGVLVDDDIDALLDVFNMRRYEVTVTGDVDEAVRRSLRTRYGATEFLATNSGTRFEVDVPDGKFYPLVDRLREAGLAVESIDRTDGDLQDIFLRVTNEAGEVTDS
ncbi:ABC transporter ATP-binding protein [Halomicrobium urmianum]|uniref:ABC transporter ATP-binding protein n=1 Tax=Halomicrobium urmianum TaxID=1586233 RepID=UPI001CD92D8C|nr:ABC transporter ATP-binding protein [Halomicrobium urmianum]